MNWNGRCWLWGLLIVSLMIAPIAVSATGASENCAIGNPNSTEAKTCKGWIDTNTDGRCDKAGSGVSLPGIAAAAVAPLQDGASPAQVQQSPLPVLLIPIGLCAGYFAAHRMAKKKR